MKDWIKKHAILCSILLLVVLSAGAAITVTQFNIIDYLGVSSAPSNPKNGTGRVYYDPVAKSLKCLNSDGTSCVTGGGGGGAPGGSNGDVQFKSGTSFTNAQGIAGVSTEFNMNGSGDLNIVAATLSATTSGLMAWEAGVGMSFVADGGDLTFSATLGNFNASGANAVTIGSTGGDVNLLANAGNILFTVGNASPVIPGSVTQRVVAGTTDTILNTDRQNRVAYNSASAVAVTLPQAGSSGFAGGFNTRLSNQNAGAVTVTPTVSTINGNATLVINEGQDCFLTPSSTGTNWAADCNEPQITAGTNIAITRAVHGITIAVTGLSPAPATLSPSTNLFVTGYTQGTGAWSTGQVTGNSVNAAASTPAYTLTGTVFAGTGTTSTPVWYYFCSGAAAPTTWSTNGTVLGLNACTGFTGKYIDIKTPNGGSTVFSVDQAGGVAAGTIAGSSGITAAAGSNLGLNGRTQMRSAADGRVAFSNNANGSLGLTRFTFGTEAATNPAFAPLSTILDVVDGAGTATLGNTTILSANGNKAFVTGNFTTAANTNLQAITGLTFNFPAVAHNWEYSCDLSYSQGTANAAVAFGIQAATNTPTNIYSTGIEQITVGPPATIVTGTLATLTTTTATNIVSGTPTATATNYTVHLAGMLELGASANAVSIMVSTATAADAVTVLRGSSCRVF